MTDISQFSPRIRRPSYLESRTPGILRGSSPVRLQNTTEGAPNHQLIHKANSSGKRIPVCSLESHSNRRRGRLRPRLVGWSPPRKPLLDIWRHEYRQLAPTRNVYSFRVIWILGCIVIVILHEFQWMSIEALLSGNFALRNGC